MFPFSQLKINTFTDMDKEQIVFLTGVTVCVLSLGAFLLWGPNPRPKRRGGVIGLQNLGLTCFLNTLLQALASCPIFIEWLKACHYQGEVAASLYYLLKVLSRERCKLPEEVQDPLAPLCLIEALRQHGWSIGQGEQDAHELFHLITVTLEEEAFKASVIEGGLTDALDAKPHIPRRNSLPTTEVNTVKEQVKLNQEGSDQVINEPSGDSAQQTTSLPPYTRLVNKHGEPITRKAVPKYDCNRNYQASPFCGLLTSQLHCVKCGFKSVVRYDKFDSLSVHLPEGLRTRHSLIKLLDSYTYPEQVTGVACDGCNTGHDSALPPVTATSLKTLTIGKLPKCLCIHIHRLSMGSNGTPYKRSDYVDFPEYLTMDPYTHNNMMKEQKLKEENQQEIDNSDQATKSTETYENCVTNILPCRTGSGHHIYRLKAVVVHCGSVNSGHFITYRRGPLLSNTRHRSDRWYFTSDETVREATLAEAMLSSAYLLFYEKCTMTPT